MATQEEFDALPEDKMFFHLIHGRLLFHDQKSGKEHFAHYDANAILVTQDKNLLARDMQRGEQALQMAFIQKTAPESQNFKILDVITQNVSFLAHCTKQEFFEATTEDEVTAENIEALLGSISGTKLPN
mgnify:CR=1 FL=1